MPSKSKKDHFFFGIAKTDLRSSRTWSYVGQGGVFWDPSMRVLTAIITREYMGKSSCLDVISSLFGICGSHDMPKVREAIWSVGASTYPNQKSPSFWTLDPSFFPMGRPKGTLRGTFRFLIPQVGGGRGKWDHTNSRSPALRHYWYQ